MAISHANCTHPRTPAGRRACRAGNAPVMVGQPYIPVPVDFPGTDREYRAQVTEIRMTGATARKLARHAAKADAMREKAPRVAVKPERIQPRRSGARVRIDASGCVQAALHTGTGRCACGWHTDNHCNPKVWACAGHAA